MTKGFNLKFTLVLLLAIPFRILAQYTVVPQTGHNETILALEYSLDGKYLASAGHDFKILLWDTKTGLHFPLYGHTTVVSELEFSPDGKHLVSTDQGGNTMVWNVQTKELVAKIINNDEEQSVGKMQFVSNDEIALQTKRMFKVWNFKTNTYPEKLPLAASTFALHPAGTDLLMLDQTSSLSTTSGFTQTYKMILYDRLKKAPLQDDWIRTIGSRWTRAAFSSTGKFLLLADGKQLVLFDYKAKKKVWQAELEVAPFKVIITPDEKKVICSGNLERPTLRVFDVASGKNILQSGEFTDFGFAYNQQQQVIAGAHDVGDFQYPIRIYDLKAQAIVKSFYPNNYQALKVAWNDQSNLLYELGKDSVIVWDLKMGNIAESHIPNFEKEVLPWKKGTARVGNTFYSSSKNYYAESHAYNKQGLDIFNKSGQKLFTTHLEAIWVAFSGDERKLFAISPDDLFVYDLPQGTLINQLHYDKGSLSSIALSSNGKHLALGKYWNEMTEIKEKYYTTDYKIDLLDPNTLKVVQQLIGHTANVASLDFTSDNRYLISGSTDGSVRFWDPVTAKQKAILYGDSPQDYFIQTDNGYYSSSKSGIDKIAFDYKGTIIPGKLFETQMNRPDKVAEALGYSTPQIISALRKAFDKRIAQLGIAEQQLKMEELPQLALTGKAFPQTVATKKIQIDYEALDNLTTLNNLKLLINNVPVYGSKGLSIKNKSKVAGKLDVELTEGMNSIELSVINSKGLSSLPVSFDIFCSVKTKPDLYLITIGVDKFLDQEYNLNYAAKDAKDIAALFESKKSNYGKFVHLPFNGMQATKENILGVRKTLEQTKPDDQVIIFAATHGLLDDKYDYYLATYNMMFDKPAFQGLAYNDLEGLMDGIPARKKLILLDACHSGEVDASEITASTAAVKNEAGVKARGFKPIKKTSNIGLDNSFDLMKNLFADLREGTGTTVISSAGGVEFAIESDQWSNGAFTAALLEGIKTKLADANHDAEITVNELKSFVFKRVIELTNGKQHPTSRVENVDNDFSIVSTISSSTTKAPSITGSWKPYEIDTFHDGKFDRIPEGEKLSISITKGVDGFYYLNYEGQGNVKLLPEDADSFKGPGGFIVKGETETTLMIFDSYMGDTRYIKK